MAVFVAKVNDGEAITGSVRIQGNMVPVGEFEERQLAVPDRIVGIFGIREGVLDPVEPSLFYIGQPRKVPLALPREYFFQRRRRSGMFRQEPAKLCVREETGEHGSEALQQPQPQFCLDRFDLTKRRGRLDHEFTGFAA